MSLNAIRPWRNIYRRESRKIWVGNVPVGGDAPISVQTMTNTVTTDAKATMEVRGRDFGGWGRARRTPADPSIPAVGEELAVARALHELSSHLLEAAASTIERHEGVRPDLHT